ncbi:hypothetical protein T492DRAFT_892613 [Pavlovales sp. CCMP2436]|nr:hypothetical protein T492DRAFT_892613 [Pavlovales sp. CCMP2436]
MPMMLALCEATIYFDCAIDRPASNYFHLGKTIYFELGKTQALLAAGFVRCFELGDSAPPRMHFTREKSLQRDLLERILGQLSAPELCVAAAACTALVRCAAGGRLFARFCEPARAARLAAALDAPGNAAVDLDSDDLPRRVLFAECLWRRVLRVLLRAPLNLRARMRGGAESARVLAARRALGVPPSDPPADSSDAIGSDAIGRNVPLRLPRDLAASLLVCDGQETEDALASLSRAGLRLLSLAEIVAEIRLADVCAGEIPLSANSGPLQLNDSSIWLGAGFERTHKACSWLALLDRLERYVL